MKRLDPGRRLARDADSRRGRGSVQRLDGRSTLGHCRRPRCPALSGRVAGIARSALGPAWLICLAWWSSGAAAHEVNSIVRQQQATVVILTFADGQPFGGEHFEAGPVAAGTPEVTGRTDADGRAIVLATSPGAWRLRAYSDDGHGVEVRFDVAATDQVPTLAGATHPTAAAPRWTLIILGLSCILAVFGLLRGRRRPTGSPTRDDPSAGPGA